MRMDRFVSHASCTAAVALFALLSGSAQEQDAEQVIKQSFQVTEERSLGRNLFAGGLMHPIVCDSRGDLYLRGAPSPLDRLSPPVMKISREAQQKATFAPERVPEFPPRQTEIADFAVGYSSEVYLLVRKCAQQKCEVAILTFAGDGAVRAVTKLEAQFDPARFVPFVAGEFLVTGFQETTKELASSSATNQRSARSPSQQPFTGIFDDRGQLVTKLALPKDQAEPKKDRLKPKQDAGKRDSESEELSLREAASFRN